MSTKDYTAQNQAVINRWEREEERKRSKAEAAEESFKRTFADTLKQAEAKKALARDARQAVDRQESGRVDPLLDKVNASGGDMFNSDRSTIVHGANGDLDSSITGEEPRPWEER
jgi:hypothetical protein